MNIISIGGCLCASGVSVILRLFPFPLFLCLCLSSSLSRSFSIYLIFHTPFFSQSLFLLLPLSLALSFSHYISCSLPLFHFWIRQYPYKSHIFCVIDILADNFSNNFSTLYFPVREISPGFSSQRCNRARPPPFY